MMEESKPATNSIPLAIVIAGLIVAGTIFFLNKSPIKAPAIATGIVPTEERTKEIPPETFVIAKDDHILGNPDAPVIIFEYSDFQCSFCKRYQTMLKQIMDQYGKTGEVALVYRHFPLETIHPHARPLAIATECVYAQGGDAAFWKAHDFIMDQNGIVDVKNISLIAKAGGVDIATLETCISADTHSARVDRDFVGGVDAGIAGTPISLIHHKDGRVAEVIGASSYAELSQIIDGLLLANPSGAK